MSSYVDPILGGEEELLQDEELIEAVEQLVETAAVSVWSGIVHDVQDVWEHLYNAGVRIFPVLLEYQEDPSRLVQDLQRLGLYMLLVAIGVWMLTPRPRRSSSSASAGSGNSCAGAVSSSTSSPTSAASRKRFCRANSDDESLPSMEEETDDERFERLWMESIAESNYRRLVLPPSCRRVAATAVVPNGGASNSTQTTPRPDKEPSSDDDNPAKRLRTYMTNVWSLIRSLLSYDYVAAARTLLSWLQGIREQRRTNSNQMLIDMSSQDDATVHSPPQPDRSPDDTSTTRSASRNNSIVREHEEEKKDASLSPTSSPKFPSLRGRNRRNLLKRESHETTTSSTNCHRQTPDLAKKPLDATDETEESGELFFHGRQLWNGTVPRPQSQKFYETATTQASLKRLVIEVATPDKNGFILGDEFLVDSLQTPLLVFVNSRSGPQQGQLLITQLRRLLNPIQVWDLADGGPEMVLASFTVLSRLRILVCGGDGTVSWIISSLEKMKLSRKWPPIAILPLGTGNDLARIHGWGGGYNNESLIGILKQVSESYISMLDRWEVTIMSGPKKRRQKEVKNFFNYLGVGADAQAALQVHYLRESRPEWFFSRMVNKAWYGVFGAEDIIKASSRHVRKEITLFADGVKVPLPPDSQGIILLNIDAYAGGVPLWSHGVKVEEPLNGNDKGLSRRSVSMREFSQLPLRRSGSLDSADDAAFPGSSKEERYARVTACDRPSSCQDGLLDVVSIRGAFHLGQIKVGLSNAQRLCQCREVTIVIKNKVALQVDGEPWRQNQCTIRIQRKKEAAPMLHRSVDDGGVETEMSKLLEWAEDRNLIDSQVHSVLLKEFSRRIESKTRQRRSKDNNIMSTLKRFAVTEGAY